MPDVILKGNGYILVHTSDLTPEPSTPTDFKVRFWPGQWFKVFQDGDPTLKGPEYDDGDEGSIKEAVSREDLMITLANIVSSPGQLTSFYFGQGIQTNLDNSVHLYLSSNYP